MGSVSFIAFGCFIISVIVGHLLRGEADVSVASLTINQVNIEGHFKHKFRTGKELLTFQSPSWQLASGAVLTTTKWMSLSASWSKSRINKNSRSSPSWHHWAVKFGCTSFSLMSASLLSSSWFHVFRHTNGVWKKWQTGVSQFPTTSPFTIAFGSLSLWVFWAWLFGLISFDSRHSCNRALTFCQGKRIHEIFWIFVLLNSDPSADELLPALGGWFHNQIQT